MNEIDNDWTKKPHEDVQDEEKDESSNLSLRGVKCFFKILASSGLL
jgi:hypothetical protein